jgi:hypothetical protein
MDRRVQATNLYARARLPKEKVKPVTKADLFWFAAIID